MGFPLPHLFRPERRRGGVAGAAEAEGREWNDGGGGGAASTDAVHAGPECAEPRRDGGTDLGARQQSTELADVRGDATQHGSC